MAPVLSDASPARSLSPVPVAPLLPSQPVGFTATTAHMMTPPNAIGPTKEWMLPPRPKPGRKLATDRSPNKRKAQNRAAQRAFRERRAARVGELEEQLRETEEGRQKREKAMREQIESQNDAISRLEAQVRRFSDETEAWHERYLQLEKRLAHEEQGKNAVLIKLRQLRNNSATRAPTASTAAGIGEDVVDAPPSRRPVQRPPPIYIPRAPGGERERLCSCSYAAPKRPASPTAQAASKRPRPSIEEAGVVTQYAKLTRTAQNLAAILNTPLPSQVKEFDSFPIRGGTAVFTSTPTSAPASASCAPSNSAAAAGTTTTTARTPDSKSLGPSNPATTTAAISPPPRRHHQPQLQRRKLLPHFLSPLFLRTDITPPPSDTDGSPVSASASAAAGIHPFSITSLHASRKPAAHALASREQSPLSRPSTAGSIGKAAGTATGATGWRFLDVVVA